ncbi:coat protein [Spring beauty latent virus]|uniref:Coat protein n=1 Tax=Spring beauty latent virus TaxID=188141 RepID=Q8JW05_9BROM|nr:coat protein [Spring beauty latent virus]BAC10648.1 coat protein [Spring beauty latent virus]
MSTSGAGKTTRAQRRAAARKNRRSATKVVQPVIVESPASGIGRPTRARMGYSVTKWSVDCPAVTNAKSTTEISVKLPDDLSSEKNKQLKVGRILIWLGLVPSISGSVKACLTEKQENPSHSFQVALAYADNSKDVAAAMYSEDFKGITLEQVSEHLKIYLYSGDVVAAKSIVVHLEVEHVKPTFDEAFTPVF